MTKEEILKSSVPLYFSSDFDGVGDGAEWHTCNAKAENIYKAMDEYAKQQSEDFARWIHKTYSPTMPNPDSWYKMGEIDKGRYTTEELYTQYLSSIK